MCRGLLPGLLLLVFMSSCAQQNRDPNSAVDDQARMADLFEHMLRSTVDTAEKICLSNTSSQQTVSLLASWHAQLANLSSGATIEKKTDVIRGAARSLTDEAQSIEDDKIRNCMNKQMQPIFSLAISYFPPQKNALWPEPIDFRFNLIRASRDTTQYTDKVRLELQTSRGPMSGRLAPEDPQGAGYYKMYVGYPQAGQVITGTIVAERKGDARLTSSPPVITDVCFKQPSGLPAVGTTSYDLFDCTEGKNCGPSAHRTGWLEGCSPTRQAQASSSWIAPLADSVYAASPEQADAASSRQTYWSVPSAAALAEAKVEGVGYTIFSLETNAFRTTEIKGVEVEVHVNGVAVREDGLPPELRPIANDPQKSFLYRFALQTLDFQGAEGCERVDLGLLPVYAGGRKGQSLSTTLPYVALRDVAPRTVNFGNAQLKWNAAYITPEREWRHLAELHSYLYQTHDKATQNSALERAETDKRWLDKQALTYQGLRIVGVLRPPRTVKPDGTAAYGLATGLVQETGQIRFTFSEKDARTLAAFMIEQRRGSVAAARVIAPAAYIFQAVGGSHTAPGVCGN